ncbi:hypothetical protein P280DRAFT_438423 [Massarina eburnea CBS 473.64]|uniref:MHD domain-containing protein n=1 Tax=Massarina eburnea CBS 473.64 TaxID=1395130 RepID=A0A6A6RHR5_9PLEO|nr:hypothetical protein P280DRAFT_438423 [Massarina eburnea CBS 473.64]
MSTIEALYIFDENNTPLLEHLYNNRPPPPSTLLPLYLAHPTPRPPLIYLPNTNPSTLLYSITQDQLLFLCPCSTDTAGPLQILEFLHRVADAFEDYLGAPLLASKIEANYDVVAQLLGEMVDGGVVSCTEPNALRDVVDAPSLLKGLLGQVGLPSNTPSLGGGGGSSAFSLGGIGMGASPRLSPSGAMGMGSGSAAQTASPVPWRRANVRHTSNEMYVDIVETLHVTISPSGRPLAAIANGTIAFTAKVSGIPDLQLSLACPGGIANAIALPVFHPCVRLNRWKERPGELSFVPPDGRFVLAGYEVDLLGPAALDAFSTASTKSGPRLNIPATVSVQTGLGPAAADFEVRLLLNPRFTGKSHLSGAAASLSGRARGGAGFASSSSAAPGTTGAPTIEDMVVHVPLPAAVRNVTDLRVLRGAGGEAVYAPGDRAIEWRINGREISALMANDRGSGTGAQATLRGTVVGADVEASDDLDGGPVSLSTNTYDYDEGGASYQSRSSSAEDAKRGAGAGAGATDAEKERKKNKVLMPSAATLGFSVKGWLPSGIKVESLGVDAKMSRGLGSGVQPYKGVKYLCVARRGVECRC